MASYWDMFLQVLKAVGARSALDNAIRNGRHCNNNPDQFITTTSVHSLDDDASVGADLITSVELAAYDMYAILSNFTEDEVENIKFIDIIDEAEYKEYMANYCNDRIRDAASPPSGSATWPLHKTSGPRITMGPMMITSIHVHLPQARKFLTHASRTVGRSMSDSSTTSTRWPSKIPNYIFGSTQSFESSIECRLTYLKVAL